MNVSMTSQQLLHLQMEDSLEFAGKRRHCFIIIRFKIIDRTISQNNHTYLRAFVPFIIQMMRIGMS